MTHQYNFFSVLLISCVATIGGFLFGFDSGVINGTIGGLQEAFNSTSAGKGFNVASMLLGCAVGAFAAGTLADKFGRRTILIVAAALFIISAWGSGVATGSFEFVIYRIIGGLAVGAASVLSPAYISELAPAHVRGRLATIQQFSIIFGLFSAFLSNYFLAEISGSALNPLWWGYDTWRWMFWIEIFPATLFLVALFFIPESPRFLVAAEREDKAVSVLSKIFLPERAVTIKDEIKVSLAKDHRPSLSDLFVNGRLRPIVWVGIGLAVFQQLVGINVVFYYGAVLWQSVGFTEADALLQNVIAGAVSIAAVIFAMATVDKIGRKPLLWIGSVGMTVTLAILVVCFSSATVDESGGLSMSDQVGTIALYSANAYVVFFNFSWGPVMWVMLGEMFPNQIRGSGLAVSGFAQWISNFGITLTFPILLASITLAGAYSIYAICALISVFFVLKYVHETRGKTLEQMEG